MDDELFEALRNLRLNIAKAKGIPPFLIYNDATIKVLIENKPKTLEELANIKSFSKSKITKYGALILEVLIENK
jgi:ATP-dependent DNA helicase RecQ